MINSPNKTYQNPILAVTALTIFMAVLVMPISVLADSTTGADFNIFPIAYTGAQNTDYPLLDARNVTTGGNFSSSQADHDDGVTASAGDTIEFLVYYHNGTPDLTENEAKNVNLKINLPTTTNTENNISATLSWENASSTLKTITSSDKGGDIKVKVNPAQQLEYVTGSALWFPSRATTGQALSDSLVSNSGVALGSVRGCWNYAGFVRFRAKVAGTTTTAASLEINKTVSNVTTTGSYAKSIDVDPSDTVRFKVEVTARNADVREVYIRDILPVAFTYQSNTTKVNNITVADTTDVFGGGYNYGFINKDQKVEIVFDAKVPTDSYFTSSVSRTLTNTSNARGRDVSTVSSTADVRVGQVLNSSFKLSKTAYNQTQGINASTVLANMGDTINYTLTYENTGSGSLNNVIIEDDITDVLKHAEIISYGGGTVSGNFIRFPSITVPAGVSIDKTFQVRILTIPSGQTDLTMTNVYGNEIDISLRGPTVKGSFIAPKTGPGENLAAIFALVLTAGWFVRNKFKAVAVKSI